ncbi:MAG: hypothetical protein IJR26_06090 [Bacteroidales bacterium]|nr:hypothetical protein [Bacteroidales bacterium]
MRLDFYWTGTRTTNGISIDSISITRLHTADISYAQEATVSHALLSGWQPTTTPRCWKCS